MSDSSFEVDLEDIDEGTVVASIATSSNILQSSVPPQVAWKDDSMSQAASNQLSSDSSKSNHVRSEVKERSLNFGSISSMPLGLPTLNRLTTDSNTYDLEYLLNKKVQRRAQGDHRFALSPTPSALPSTTKNFIAKNKGQAGKFGPRKAFERFTTAAVQTVTENCDVQERFWDKAARTEEKLRLLREEQDQMKVEGCTFSPQTNLTLPYRRRSNSEFAENVENFLTARDSKLDMLRSEQQLSLSVDTRAFTPSLCARSRTIVERQGQRASSAFERLHSRKQSRFEMKLERLKSTEVFSFSPKINSSSALLSRTTSVHNLLYDDAITRHSRACGGEDSPQRHLAKKSNGILLAKLLSEFDLATGLEEGPRLNYSQVKDVMTQLKFVPAEGSETLLDMWNELGGKAEGGVHKDSMLHFLGAVLCLEMPRTSPALQLTKERKAQLHSKYHEFYLHRTVQSAMEKRMDSRQAIPSFTPQLDKNSLKLHAKVYKARSQHSKGQSIGDLLGFERQKTKDKLEQRRQQQEVQESSQCSFKPSLVSKRSSDSSASCGSAALFQYSKEQKQTRAELIKHAEAEKLRKETEDCTFSPVINGACARSRGVLPEQAKAISRLRTARAQHVAKESLKEKGMTPRAYRQSLKTQVDYKPKQVTSNFSKRDATMSRRKTSSCISLPSQAWTTEASTPQRSGMYSPVISKMSSLAALPYNELVCPAEEDEIVLSLKVNITPTHSDTLTVLEGEDPYSAVETFVAKHNLGEKERTRLQKYMKTHGLPQA